MHFQKQLILFSLCLYFSAACTMPCRAQSSNRPKEYPGLVNTGNYKKHLPEVYLFAKHEFKTNPCQAILNEVSLSYQYRPDYNKAYEFTAGFVYSDPIGDGMGNSFDEQKIFMNNGFTLRAGYKRYFTWSGNMYLGVEGMYRYLYCSHKELMVSEYQVDPVNYEVISQRLNVLDLSFLVGIETYALKGGVVDLYCGLGFRMHTGYDIVEQEFSYNNRSTPVAVPNRREEIYSILPVPRLGVKIGTWHGRQVVALKPIEL